MSAATDMEGGRLEKEGAGAEFEAPTRSGCRRGRQPLQTARLPRRNDFMADWRSSSLLDRHLIASACHAREKEKSQ